MVDELLQALGLVTLRNERALMSRSGTLLDSSRLTQSLVMSLHLIDHDPPLSIGIHSTQRHHITRARRTQIGLVVNVLDPIHRVIRVGNHILVQRSHRRIMILNGMLDLTGGIFVVGEAPGFGRVLGASGWSIVGLVRVRCGGLRGTGMMGPVRYGGGSITGGRRIPITRVRRRRDSVRGNGRARMEWRGRVGG